MLKEFRNFLMRGNIVELAIAVVLGVAFAAVVTALVQDLITPIVAAIGGKRDFGGITFEINGSTFRIGAFINAVIAFVTIAAAIFFLVVKPLDALAARKGEDGSAPAPPPEEIVLLREIRDALRARD